MPSSYTPALATPVSIANGGTGAATAPLALMALGAQADILSAFKPAPTSRNTTVTFADDPDLIVAIPAGRYYVRTFISVKVNGVVPGSMARMNYTGSKSLVSGSLYQAATTVSRVSPDFSGADAIFSGLSSVLQELGYIFDFGFTATTAGNLSLQWAQSVSDPADTIVQAGWMTVTPL